MLILGDYFFGHNLNERHLNIHLFLFTFQIFRQNDLHYILSHHIRGFLQRTVHKYFQLNNLQSRLVLHSSDSLQAATNAFINNLVWIDCSLTPATLVSVYGRSLNSPGVDETRFMTEYLELLSDFSHFVRRISSRINIE